MSSCAAASDGLTRSASAPCIPSAPRTIHIGILGLGNVGQAVARLAASSAGDGAGVHFRVDAALVRDVNRTRRCLRPPRVTSNVSAFLRGRYDVVIEMLGGLEPARTIVARLLGRGVPVVTANKTLIAEAGRELQALATARGTKLRYEASAMAGVPFLGTLAARPLVSAVDRFTAVLNGTSNFILSALEADGGTFEEALAIAQRRGLAEPDASRDVDGDDAADKLVLLTNLLGWGSLMRPSLEVRSLRTVSTNDLRAARWMGGALKPVAIASRVLGGVEACIGPAWVPGRTPLAALGGALNGIELHGRYVRDLFFSGPGAGPDITAATLLDDVVEAVRERNVTREYGPRGPDSQPPRLNARRVSWVGAPVTPWFIRVEFPGVVPPAHVVTDVLTRTGLIVERVTDAIDNMRYVLAGPANRTLVEAALDHALRRHRLQCVAFRRVD